MKPLTNSQKQALTFILQKVDRIVAEDADIKLNTVVNNSFAQANVEKKAILLNFDLTQKTLNLSNLFDYIVAIKGLNYHELSHLLFTDIDHPAIEHYFYKSQKIPNTAWYDAKDKMLRLFNLLEDCRIEMLFSSLYPRARYFFTYTASKILLEDTFKKTLKSTNSKQSKDTSILYNYFLLFGREFLSSHISHSKLISNIKNYILSKNIISPEKLKECEELIQSFTRETDIPKRCNILFDFYLLLVDNKKMNAPIPQTSSESSSDSRTNRSQVKKKVKEALENLKVEEQEDEEEAQNSPNQEEEEEEEVENSNSMEEINEKIREVVENALSEITDLNSLREEIQKDAESISMVEDEKTPTTTFNPNGEDLLSVAKVERVLRNLRSDLAASFKKNQTRGRLDINSAMKSSKNHSLRIFEKRKKNRVERTKMAVSFILDASGSVNAQLFEKQIKTAWVMTRAFQNLKNRVEVFEFSNKSRVLKSFDNAGDWQRAFPGGDTLAASSIQQSIKDLIAIKKKENIDNLYTIIISDGDFTDHYSTIKLIKEARRLGIKVFWVLAKNGCYVEDVAKNVNHFIQISSLSDLPEKLRRVVTNIQRELVIKAASLGDFYG